MKLCMGCMEEVEDNVIQCPYCGYNEADAKQESYYLSPGTVVGGKYIVGRALKYKGYTINYLGMDAEKKQKVIIREYLPNDFSTRSEGENEVTIYSGDALEQFNQGLMNFLNESSRIQSMGSVPGVIQVYDCIAENETGYAISEYLEGNTLQELLDAGKKYTPQEAGQLMKQLLSGLARLHKNQVVHCDIAPENIVILPDGTAKLVEFGAMRYVTTANSKSLAIILKQGYAPEEQYRSKGQKGPWTDVYAMGAVMYRLITGKIPMESVERTLQDDLAEPSKLGISIPENMENALMNALNIYQQERTPSAGVFLQELDSSHVKRIKVKRKKRETGKMPKWGVALVAVLACFVIAGGGLVVKSRMEQKDARYNDEGTRKFSEEEYRAEEDFDQYWTQELGLDAGKLKKTYLYDASLEGGNQITVFGELYHGQEESQIKDLKKVNLTIASNHEYTFQTDWLDNCPDEEEYGMAIEESDDDSEPYGAIKSVEYKGESYSAEDIRNKEKQLPNPVESSDMKVVIFVGDYYTGMVSDQVIGKNWTNVKNYTLHGKNPDKNVALPQEKIDAAYYSFETEDKEGIIKEINENIKNGKYDSRKTLGTVFTVIKKKLSYGVTTVKDLRDAGAVIENNGNYASDQIVLKCSCDANGGKAYFKAGQSIRIQVKEIVKATQAPVQNPATKAPVPQNTVPVQPTKEPDSGPAGGAL